MPVNDYILLRKGSGSEWSTANPVLASGEPGYDLTNKIFKIGDGISVWTQLSGVNQNIAAGYDISITNNSGIYTIASTNLVHVDSQQPQGFVNRTDSRISVSGNIFRIEPTGSSYSYYNKGIKVVKTSGDSLTIPNLTQINYIHFDTVNNQISNKTTGFDFSSDIPIAYVAWNSGVGPSGQMTFFAEERHGIVMDTSTHKWIHYTFGAQYVDGLSIGNYVLGGNGSSNTHATISIGNGTLFQEDIVINITDSSSTDPFCQELSPIAQIPVYYHEGSTGQWVKNTATDYPVKYGANGPQYNLLTGGNWTIPDVSPGGQTRYFAVWILATNQIDDPIISIMGQRIDSNQGSAESNNSWSDVNLTNLPLSEVKPLYRLIFAGDSDYTNVPKCTLLSILDIRVAVISTIAGVAQNDHGSLFGLGDDDHSQYLHIDNNRTVNAIHNFVNGLTSNGLINSTSGNFTNLAVNNTGVSLSGHTHSSSDITNFNSSVSGLVNGIYAPLTGTLNQFANTTSSQLSSVISDETGSGLLVFNNSPTFTGVPLVPTATSGTNTNQIASTSFVRTEISNLVNSAPSTLDTLNELAAALGNDANFSTTITNTLAGKASLSGATFTGSISAPSGNFTQSLQVNGTGVSLSGHTHTASQITDFNSSVSGLLPVKNIVAGTGIFLSSSDGIFTIHATGTTGGSNLNTEDVMDIIGTGIIGGTGISVSYDDTNGSVSVNLYASAITGYEILSTTKDTFSVSPNYLVGNLSVYYNGFKLLYGEDYTATDGSTFVLSNPGASGDVVEWAGLGGPAQYASLTHSHGNITNSGSLGSTSGLVLVTKSGGAIDVGSGLYYDSNKLGIGTNSLSGVLSLSNGYFNNDGDSKQTLLTLRNSTSNASTTTLYTDGSSSKLVLPVSGVWNFNINLTCLSISNSGAAGWHFRGCIKRNSSTTALVGSIIEENFIDSSLNGVAATVVANTGTSSLDINVNGLVSNNIRWTAATNLVQTYYG